MGFVIAPIEALPEITVTDVVSIKNVPSDCNSSIDKL